MKWYSVKKFRPPADVSCFIRTVFGTFYTAKWKNGSECWMNDTFQDLRDGITCTTQVFNVTHFCIPEPVEIE